ncbi:NAD(P)H-dependent oxidoreductase [Companilactobacillus baiquanensis]|uniref:NAD(P)H-dependent oxidoreductase n=1 Tax=Companilactobacillus baiquanensis TaxID=2486005 RepID=A0ABW1UV35_9LACO|nr:NAD(P)H-dependent oxidoreductase [Companilactobacillus baiquanensis]
MKTLIIVSHPEIENSQTQQFLYQGSKLDNVTWNHVEEINEINIKQEQQLLTDADRIIFQFPLYWYSAPSGLKNWEDTVLTRNFIYGDKSFPLEDKEFGLVVTTGLPLKDYQKGAAENYSLDELMTPFRAIADKAKMKILPIFTVQQFWYKTELMQMELLIDYQRYLTQDMPDSLANKQIWFEKKLQEMSLDSDTADERSVELILDNFLNRTEELEQLNDTLSMIKENEED